MARRLDQPQKALGLAIRRRRNERDLTAHEVARTANVNVTHYSRLENGRVNPSWGTVRRVAEALDVAVSELAALAEQIERDERSER